MQNEHLTKECPLVYLQVYFDVIDQIESGDELCEQLWAEIYIMRTLRYKDFKHA